MQQLSSELAREGAEKSRIGNVGVW
jgi:hypothetical protein